MTPIGADEATRLAREEYARFLLLLRRLDAAAWSRPTDCPGWDVRTLAAHVLGATEANASPVEMGRQVLRGREGAEVGVDAVSAVQVEDRRDLTPAQILTRFDAAAPRALRWRRRFGGVLGLVPFPVGAPVHERWRLRYLVRVIYTRDTWMHRIDVCRATGHAPVLTPEHDGSIVADVVAEWAARHGRPFRLVLEGPAGGEFTSPAATDGAPGGEVAPPQVHLDAVEFARTVSGRRPGEGLLATLVPF